MSRSPAAEGTRATGSATGRAPLHEAAIALAGPIAQDRHAPTRTPAEQRSAWRKGWRVDLEIMRRHLESCGADQREQWLIHHDRVSVRQHWPAILRVAAALHERGSLTGADIALLLDPHGVAHEGDPE
jgi:hypothetical protein